SCKIEYYIKTNFAYFSGQSAFFTDDYKARGMTLWLLRSSSDLRCGAGCRCEMARRIDRRHRCHGGL
ncbi:hypothetical protein, partial [Bradyrhizobium jicamae]|uniref:hypothetical protein n=1 Tax=Bradyrhizobium jicamae TaxID=280332 RepID=UPI001BAA9B4E